LLQAGNKLNRCCLSCQTSDLAFLLGFILKEDHKPGGSRLIPSLRSWRCNGPPDGDSVAKIRVAQLRELIPQLNSKSVGGKYTIAK